MNTLCRFVSRVETGEVYGDRYDDAAHLIDSAVKADTHATWSWQDPRPALANVSAVLGKLWQFVGRSERADDSH